MNYLDLDIIDIHNALLNKKIKVSDLVKEALNRAKNNKNNAFELLLEDDALKKANELDKLEVPKDNYLFGIPYVAKDNFSTKDIPTTASSNILNGYVPLFDATVVKILNENNAILIGKTTLDELAMGGTGTTSHKGITTNPYDETRLIGGSSSGSAVCVVDAITPFALGSDTGDSVRKPAHYGGIVGFKPTWGLVSRFGLFPFAPSLDHVAYFTKSVRDSALLLDYLNIQDINDATNSTKEREEYLSKINNSLSNKKIAIVKEILDTIENEDIKKLYISLINKLKENGATIEEVHISKDILNAIYPSYVIISCAEATSNNANLDGIKFGNRIEGKTYDEIMFNTRTQGFSSLIKRRFVIGSYSLMSENQEELFLRAQKARHLIVDCFNNIFKDYDGVLLPAGPKVAKKINESSENLSLDNLIADNYMAYGNFGGFPSITIPMGFVDNLPVGVNLTCKAFDEVNMFQIANNIEQITGLKDLSSRNYKNKKGE